MAKPKPNPDIAARLKLARAALFKTAADAAAALGVNPITLRTHEAGTRAPSFADLQRYARRYGVALDWLISGKGDQSDPPQADTLRPDEYPVMAVLSDRITLPDSDDADEYPGWGPISSESGVPEVASYSDGRFPAELIDAFRVSTDRLDGLYLDGSVVFAIPAWEIGYRPGDHVVVVWECAGGVQWSLRQVEVVGDQTVFRALISDGPPLIRSYDQDRTGEAVSVVGVVVAAIIRRPVPPLSIRSRQEVEAQRRLKRLRDT